MCHFIAPIIIYFFSRPTPSITWKKNGEPIVDGINSFTILSSFYGRRLDIDNVNKAHHQDVYSCEGDTSAGGGSILIHNISLLVEGMYNKVKGKEYIKGPQASEGEKTRAGRTAFQVK